MYLSILSILKDLWIEHSFFVAAEFGIENLQNQEAFSKLVETRFPHHMKRLHHETPTKLTESNTADSLSLRIQGLEFEMPFKETGLIEGIIRQKKESVPSLEVLFLDFDNENPTFREPPTFPDRVYKLAEDHGVIFDVLFKAGSSPVDHESDIDA